MKVLAGVLTALLLLSANAAFSEVAAPAKAFMQVYSNITIHPVESDAVGIQIVLTNSGPDEYVLWQEAEGAWGEPKFVQATVKGEDLLINIPDDGDWLLHVGKTQIVAVGPNQRREVLKRVRSLR